MARRCRGDGHPEGEVDDRVVGFYESLRGRYPDFPPYPDDSPWMSVPLDVGIDHVSVCMSFGEGSWPALDLIFDLAGRCGLTIYDPQDGKVIRPHS
ncbi:hypothetical protein [Phytohabitans houttuyneae]|uniref:Uncharacterized protein n=1 Tax=Phytohabitans houttuyneae TaxID=1076126 RepID=A0A6V8KNZ2_9ACTN|nr:hypothetical protein [Phytohabitans houttuyneae]GFJ83909.1 hypothetical protein Phou_080890 [Phytohabitans houttuyneae]